jgi:hypothetical protein
MPAIRVPPPYKPVQAQRNVSVAVPKMPVMQAKLVKNGLAPPPARLPAARQQVLQCASFKKLEGQSVGNALRITGAGVTASGTLTLADGSTYSASGANGDGNWNLGPTANRTWQSNHDDVKERIKKGQKVPYPDNDAEASVLQKLRDTIVANGLVTNGATLALSAYGTSICKYCKRLIRAFCRHYGITWANDPG